MYNRYVRNDAGQYQRIPTQEPPPPGGPPPEGDYAPPTGGPGGPPPPPPPRGGEKRGFLSGLLSRLNLERLEIGRASCRERV